MSPAVSSTLAQRVAEGGGVRVHEALAHNVLSRGFAWRDRFMQDLGSEREEQPTKR